MRQVLIVFILLFFLNVPPVFFCSQGDRCAFAQDKKTEAGTPEKGQDLDAVLNTLNETLGENRQLKAKLKQAQDEAARVMAEGNVLRGQLQLFEKEKNKTEKVSQTNADRLTVQFQDQQKEVAQLKKTVGTHEQEQKKLQTQNEDLTSENLKLKGILKSSILEEEKDQYTKLIAEAQKANESAVQKISEAEKTKEILKKELADMHFKSGNAAFDRRDFETAILHYQKTLDLEPSTAYAHHNLGIIYDYYLSNQDKAIYHYRCYLNLKPVEENANEIRERILELRLGKAMIPDEPLKKDYYHEAHYTN